MSPQDALGLLACIPNPGPATHKTQSRGRGAAALLAFLLRCCCGGWPGGWWACDLALVTQSARDHQPRLGFQKEAWGTWQHTGHLGCQEKRLKRDLNFCEEANEASIRRHSLVSILVFCKFKMCDYMVSCVSVLYVCSVECVCVHVCEYMCL